MSLASGEFDLNGEGPDGWLGLEQWGLTLRYYDDADEDQDDDGVVVGRVAAVVVDTAVCPHPWDALDSLSGDLMTIADSLFEPSTGEWLSVDLGGKLLIIDMAQIDRAHRGKRLGLFMVGTMVEKVGARCEVIVCWPGPTEDPRTVEGVRALQEYWSRIGFVPLASNAPDELGRRTYILSNWDEFETALAELRESPIGAGQA